jgi:Ca2+-binding RTX toxin-like protein
MANNPTASDDTVSAGKNIRTTIDVLANDTDTDGAIDPTMVVVVDGPDHGTLSINATTGKVTYTPTKNYVGADTFTYTVKDNEGNVSDAATVTLDVASKITLTSANEAFAADAVAIAPVEVDGGAGDDYLSGSSNPSTAGADKFYGGDGNDIIFGAGGDDYIEGNAGQDYLRSGSGIDTLVGGDGLDTYGVRFFANKTSSTVDTGTVTIIDTDGVLWNGAPRPATVPVEWSSQPPAAAGYQVAGAATLTGTNTWDLVVPDDNGGTRTFSLTRDGADLKVAGGNEVVTIKDYVNGTFGITLAGENVAPTVSDDTVSAGKNIRTTIDVLANDTDTDGTVDPTTVVVVDGPDHGTLSINATTGKVTYTPTKNYVGADTFTYTVKDNEGNVSDAATVTLDVASKITLTSANEAFAADAVAIAPVEVDGGAGDDYLSGSSNPSTAGADKFYGGDGNDIIFGAGGDDYIEGNAGQDYLRSGSGIDTLVGGDGLDTYGVRFFANKTSSTVDTGTVTIIDTDGVLWNGAPRPTTVPVEWSSQPPAAAGYQVAGAATLTGTNAWDLVVPDDNGGTRTFSLTRDGADLKVAGGNEVVTIKDYVNGTFGITLAGENTGPEITSNGAGDSVAVSIAENTMAVTTVTATDADAGSTLTYSISAGADKDLFQIDATTGVLSFKAAPDFELPTDNGGDNVYDVTIRVTDNAGAADEQAIAATVTDVTLENHVPTNPVLSASSVAENSAMGTVIGTLSSTDADGDALTFSLIDNAGGKFALKTTGSGPNAVTTLVVNGALDYEMATSHQVTVQVSDMKGGQTTQTFSIGVTDVQDPAGTITINASGAGASGMSFESFVSGGFLAGTSRSGWPTFDNGGGFSGSEMFMDYGTSPTSKYVLMDGSFTYDLTTHTIAGTAGTIQYGTRGTGTFDASGKFAGGNAILTITGLAFSDLVATSAQAGQIHNFAVAHMSGATGDAAGLIRYAAILDSYAQNFVGSVGNDIYTGTVFNDTMTGNGGNDVFDGGAGSDTIVFSAASTAYTIGANATSGLLTVTNIASGAVMTVSNIERVQFSDKTIDLTANKAPTGLALSTSSVLESATIETVIGTLSATDPDGDALTYSLVDDANGHFKLVTSGGATQLVLASAVDYETATSHPITIRVSDLKGGTATDTFTIDVIDVLEGNLGLDIELSQDTIAEDASRGAVVGRLSVPDADGDVSWSLSGGGGKFALETNGKGVTRLVVDGKLDYETRSAYTVTVTASDGDASWSEDFTINITDVAEVIRGTSSDDKLNGDATADILRGGAGNDRLIGGGGADRLTGGPGADTFVFTAIGQSTPDAFDVITDFKGRQGDRVDLSGIDAIKGESGNQAFSFIGRDAFSGTAGELRVELSGNHTVIWGDVDGDGAADFAVHILGALNMKEEFFVL